MRAKSEIVSRLLDPGIIAIVRMKAPEQVPPLIEALLAGGIVAIEITMTTPNALAAIREAAQKFGARAVIGVGTVLDAQTCRQAIEAGAEFIVSPITRPEIAAVAREFERPVMLGAYTPTEAQLAHEAGADFLKAGCAALGVGSSLITAPILRDGNWPELTRLAREFVQAAQNARAPVSGSARG